MPKWVADAKAKKKKDDDSKKIAQSVVNKTVKAAKDTSKAVSNNKGQSSVSKKNNMTDAQYQKTYGKPRNTGTTSQRTQTVKREPVRRTNPARVTEAQRQKMGINDQPSEETKRAANRALRNTPGLIKKAGMDAGSGYLQTLNDVTERIAKNENGTKAKAMKMGIEEGTKQYRELEQEQKRTAEKARQDSQSLYQKMQDRQAEWDEKIKDAKGLEKAYYGAVESGTGMIADTAIGLLTGTGEAGALASMGLRTYGASVNQARAEGATDTEAAVYGLLQAGKEMGTEKIGGGGLAKMAYGKGALGLGDIAANTLIKNLKGSSADLAHIGVGLLGDVAEENIEEGAGWLLDPWIKELTYGRRTRQANAMRERSDALKAEILNEDDARAAAAYLSSDDFIEQNVKEYMAAGLSKKDAEEVAERMRDYLAASLTGDTDSMEKIEDEVSKKVVKSLGVKGTVRNALSEYSFKELKETVEATTLLVGVTGMGGNVSTSVKGAAIREQLGAEGVNALANTAIDFENSRMSNKAKAMKARIDSGKELTSTQVYELQAAMQEQVRKDTEREQSSRRMAARTIESDNLLTPYRQNQNGGIDLDEVTEAAYREHANKAGNIIDAIVDEKKESITDTQKVDGSKAIAGFQTGVFTVDDANALNFSNTAVRAAFETATGVDLGQYVVKNKDGSVNIPATNTKTKDALFAMAADNLVKSAQAETQNWMDNTKGQVVTQVSARMGASGSAVLQQALDDVDERDRSKYMMTANATDMLYQAARNMGTEWSAISSEATRMFPGISESKLQMMYEAGLADREMANDKARGRQVRMGQALTEMGEQETATGKVFIDTEVPVKGSVIRTFTEIAKNLGADIHFVDYIYDADNNPIEGANGSYDPNTNTFYLNVATGAETNIGYIFMHETTHYLKTYAPEQYQALENLVRERWFAFNPSQMQDAIARKIEAYKRATKGQQVLTEEQALEEIIADASHDFINDPEFAKQVAEEDMGLAKAVLDSIRNALRMLRRIFASGSIDNDTHMNSLFRELDIMTEAEKLWLDAYKMAVQNSAINAVNEWQDNVNAQRSLSVSDEDLERIKTKKRTNKRDREILRDAGEKLKEDDFYNLYTAHIINLGGKGKNADQMVESIKENGFKGSGGFGVNLVDSSINNISRQTEDEIRADLAQYGIPEESIEAKIDQLKGITTGPNRWIDGTYYEGINITVDRYGGRKGQTVMFVPEHHTTNDRSLVETGFKPFDYEVVKVERDFQPYYELYSKAYDEAHESRYSITTDKEDFIKGANLSKDLRDWAKEMGLDKLSKQPIKGPVIVSVRDLRTAWYEKNGRSDEANVINTALDKIGDSLTQLVGKYQYIDLGDALNAAVTYRTDAEGHPTSVILSCQVKNAEYEVNFDFTTICAKRLAMQKILERFIKTEGERQGTTLYDELKLDEEGLYKLRLILETAGFEVSCRGCFVEQNRYSQQNQARTIANDWNAAIDEWEKENNTKVTENFDLVNMDINALNYEEIQEAFNNYTDLMSGRDTNVETKNRTLIEAHPFFRKRMNPSDYASTAGQRALMAIGVKQFRTKDGKSKKGTTLYGLLKRGQSDSKQSVPFTAYNGEISLLPDNMKGKSLYDYLLSIGGARAQSASDFQIEFVYDYMQMVADLSARGLPMHMYTKVIELAELFGMTGIKINLSAMCDVAEDVGGEYAGLKLVDGKYEYNISDQSIDYPKAVELQKREGYSKNIGIIMVTLSSQHMLKSLDDPDVRYIIGYHSSAMPVVVANMSNMGGATDYTKINKTNKLNEKGQALFDEAMAEAKGNTELEKYKDALRIFDEKIQEETAKKKKKPRRGNEYGAYMSAYGNNTADFNTYDSLLETKDARKTADKYLEHCMENDLIPIYFPFAFHENYYKCEVYDFNMYDNNTGEYAPMESVQNIYPGLNMAAGETDTTAFTERVSEMMDERNRLNESLDSQYDAVFDEAKKELKYSISGDDYMDFDASGINHNELTHRADAPMTAEQQRDADYMAAVNSGNMDEAQRLVDEAAKVAGYTERVYHGTGSNFTVFDINRSGNNHGGYSMFGKGFYFSDSEAVANIWGKDRKMMHTFIRLENPYIASDDITEGPIFDAFTELRNKWGFPKKDTLDGILAFETLNEQYGYDYTTELLKENGYDGVVYTHPESKTKVKKEGSKAGTKEYIVFDAENIKSAEPVTYDIGYKENGNRTKTVIPLSERFDPTNNDIRYSLPTQDSSGNVLSDGQMDYFKNSQARNEDGKLIRFYHYTDNGRFTIFDPSFSDDHRSLFFTDDWTVGVTYTSEDSPTEFSSEELTNGDEDRRAGYYPVYLNLTNPLIVDADNSGWNMVLPKGYDRMNIEMSEWDGQWDVDYRIAERGPNLDVEWGDSEYERFDSKEEANAFIVETFGQAMLDYLNANDNYFDDIYSIDEQTIRPVPETLPGLDTGETSESTRQIAERAYYDGYDGVIFRNLVDIGGAQDSPMAWESTIAVAFTSNQVKLTDNKNPTENPDIRYSFSDEDDLYSYMASVSADSMTNEELAYYEQIAETEEKHNDYLGKMRKWSEDKISEFYESLVSNDEMPSENEKTEEGRIRMSKAREDFFNSLDAKWNDKWLSNGEVLDLKSVKPRIKHLIMAQMRGADATRQYKTDVLNRTLFDVRTAYMMAKRGRIEVADEIIWNSARNMIANLEFVEERADYETFKEIRDFVKGHRIQIDEGDFPSHDHYKEFLKSNFGRMTLVKDGAGVDQVWQALNEKYGNLFPEDVVSPLNQLEWIADYLNSYEPIRWAYSSEQAAALAFDIADELGNIVFGYGKPIESLADYYKSKYEEKAKALKARCEEAERELRKTRRENESNEAKIARLQEKNQRIEKKLADEKQKAKDKAAKKKDIKERARYTGRIQKNYDWLTKRLLQPTKDKNIPEGFRKDLARLLCMFDLQTERSKELEQKYGIPSQKTFKMWDLHSKLCNVMNEDNGGIFQTNAYIEFLSENLAKRIDGKSIDSLETPDLLAVDEYLKIIVHQFREYDKVRVGEKRVKLEDLGGKVIQESDDRVSKRGQSKEYGGLIKALDSVVNFAELTPIHFFQRMGTMYTMYKEVRKSFDKYIRNEKYLLSKIQNICGEYYTEKKNRPGSELEAWRDSRSAQELRLKNGTVTMTVAQMMSLYCLSKRNQARLHLIKDGIVVTPITEGAKIEKARADFKGRKEQIHSIQLTLADIDLIKTKLTPDQMNIADKLQELMSGEMAEWGNEMSMKLYGIRMFKESDYFPIKVSSRVTEKNLDDIDITETIKNFGFTKPTQPEARNAIEVDDIFKVVADHCNNMNLYNAYGESISDFWRVFNYKQYSDEGKPTKTVQQALEEAYGKKAIKYIKNFIKDINGNVAGKRSGGLEEALNTTLGRAKKAAVFGNMRVALQQPTAIVRAFAVLSPKYIGAIRVHKGAMQEMFEHCPIAQWKAWGFYDTYMGRDIEDVMMNKWSMSDTALSGIYGQLDNITWTAIWQMCKAEVKDTHPNVKEGTQEFWNLCNERASEVFDKTQVVDSPFHRSDAMRSKDIMVKSLTSFQSEPTLTFNVVRSGFAEAADALRNGNKAEFTKKIAGTVLVFVAQAAVVSATAAIWDAVRRKNPDGGDDDDKKWVEFWTMNFFNNLKDNINLLNNIYLVKEIMPYIDKAFFGGYGSSNNLLFQSLDTLTNGITQFQKKLEKGDAYDKSWYDVLTNLFGGFGYMFGIPVKTLMKDFKGITSWLGLDVLAADEESLINSVAEKMGYKPIEKTTESKWFDYERNPLKVTDGSTFDNILNHFGWNLTEREKEQIAADEAAKAQAAKAEEIAGKTADLTGEAKDKKVWSYVTSYMKAENGDKPFADVIQEGDYKKVQEYRAMYVAAGGDTEYFDERIFATSKSAMKKTIIYDPTDAQIEAQDNIKNYLLTHGMSDYELSEMAYKSNTAKDMKIAFMINDKDAMLETLEPLVRAGLSYEDLERIWDNRNRIDVMKYKSSKGRYADRLKSTGKFIWPTNGQITSYFGYRNAPTRGASSNHPAIDIGAPMGADVVASDGGVVIYVGWNGGYGNSVGIKHDNGMVTYYNHLSAWNVKVGDTVAQGQPIANVGSTGISTGPHLDFKVLDANGKPVDPLKYLASRS